MNTISTKNPPEIRRRTVVLSALLLFLVICAFIVLKSVRDALFLSHFTPSSLAYFMALNTAVTGAFATVYLRLQKRFSLTRVVQFTFCAFGIATLVMWFSSALESEPFAGMLYIWVGVIGTIAPVQAWSLVAAQFLTREARSSMGILSGSATLGAVAGGFLARAVAGFSPVPLLILIGSLITLAAFLVSLLFQDPVPGENANDSTVPEEKPVRRRLVWLLIAVVVLGTIVSAFIDFQFKTIAQRHMTSATQLATFFGTFYGSLGIVALAVQFLVIPLLMKRFRLSFLATMMPVLLLCVNVVFLFTRFFAAAISLRGLDEVLRHSTDRSSMEVIYVAMPDNARVRIRGLIDTIGVRGADGVAALLLMIFFSWRHWPVGNLILLNVILMTAWAVAAFVLTHSEYPRMLQDEIERKDINLQMITDQLFTPQFYRYIPLILRYGEKDMVLSLLLILENSGKRWLGRYLLIGLQREEEEIRWKSLQLLFDQDARLPDQVRPLLNDNSVRIRREAIHYVCLRSGKKALAKTEDPDLSIQVAQLACGRKESLSQETADSLSGLLRMARDQNNSDARVEIAHVLQYTKPSKAAVLLYRKLLADKAVEVQTAALASIRQSKPLEIIPEILNLARYPGLREVLQSTLAAYGPMLLPYLSTIIDNDGETPAKKKLALRIAADVGGIRAFDLIVRAAQRQSLHLRFQAIKALNRLHRRHPLTEKQEGIMALLDREAETLITELRRRKFLSTPAETISYKVASQRISWAYQRIFRLLGLLYDPRIVHSAYEAWNSEDPVRIDVSMELLDQTMSPELRRRFLPLLEDPEDVEKETENASRFQAIQEYLQEEDPLPAAAAIRDLPDHELKHWRAELKTITVTVPELIKETLNWRINMLDEEEKETTHPLTTLQKVDALSKIPLFAQLGPQELLLLADQSKEIALPAGTSLFEKGDPSQDFYCLVTGRVELTNSGTLALLDPGECIGLSDLLRGQPRILTASARTDSVALVITEDSFWEILDDYSTITYGLIKMLAEQVDTLTERLASRGELIQG